MKFNKHLNRNGRNIHFDPWGGHILKDPHISFGDVYPKLPWFDSRPNAFEWWFDQSLGWDIDTGEGGVYYDLKQKVKPPYLFQGYFFNKLYWHHERDYILEIFEPDENITNYIDIQRLKYIPYQIKTPGTNTCPIGFSHIKNK